VSRRWRPVATSTTTAWWCGSRPCTPSPGGGPACSRCSTPPADGSRRSGARARSTTSSSSIPHSDGAVSSGRPRPRSRPSTTT
jgi:hypothetical protein